MIESPKNAAFVDPEVKKQGKFLAILISLLLPWLNFLNNSSFEKDLDFLVLIPKWLVVSLLLYTLWQFDEKIASGTKGIRTYVRLFAGSILLISVFMYAEHYVFPDILKLPVTVPAWAVGFKLFLASALFATIQLTLKSTRANERLRSENFELESENYRAQLEQLQKQVNPHFLFNSLSTLRTIIRSDGEQSEEFVLKLSDVYRQILQTRESNTVTLKEELDFLNAYIYLVQVRHNEALIISMEIAEESMQYSLPVFALQLLIENCIKHNVISEQHPLNIQIFQKDTLSITVSNNVQPKKTNVESLGVGLTNLKQRYELMRIPEGIEIEQNEQQFSVTLKLF